MNGVIPSISIVLPTYNRASYIIDTIQSVLQQSHRDWELVIVNDCSTDNTGELVNQINDARIKLIRTNDRVGITASREKGVQESRSDLIAFMDSDDLWDEKKLEKQFLAFQQYPEAGYCLTGGFTFKHIDTPLHYYNERREGMNYGNFFTALYDSKIAALTPTLMFRKNCLEKIEFSTHVEFILELASHFNGIMIYDPLLKRRLHESNTSVLEWENRDKEGFRILKKYGSRVPKSLARHVLYKAQLNSGENYLSHKKNVKAFKQFFRAWTKKPFNIIPIKKMGKTIIRALFK